MQQLSRVHLVGAAMEGDQARRPGTEGCQVSTLLMAARSAPSFLQPPRNGRYYDDP